MNSTMQDFPPRRLLNGLQSDLPRLGYVCEVARYRRTALSL